MATTSGTGSLAERVQRIRSFNRFYTAAVGALDRAHLGSRYHLTEVRVLYELARRGETEAQEIRAALGLDASYLSRILARFEADGLLERERSHHDARRRRLRLTDRGRAEFGVLDERASAEVRRWLGRLDETDQQRLLEAMSTVEELVAGPGSSERTRLDGGGTGRPFLLRPLAPGDLGWVVQRNGELYATEYGFDQRYEALVARIVADYHDRLDPERENAWIAELQGRRVGSVFCVRYSREPETTAQLRLLLVEPDARGQGIGSALVDECLRFAREAGYRRMVLWTTDVLAAARRLYQRAGFMLLESEPHDGFGPKVTGQYWGRDL